MSKQPQYTIAEMEQQIRQLEQTIQLPGVPAEEIEIYRDTIERIRKQIQQRQSQPADAGLRPVAQPPQPKLVTNPADAQIRPIDHHTQPPHVPHPFGGGAGGGVDTKTTPRVIHAGPQPAAGPITSRIEVEHQTDPHNPRITITWSDRYTITVDETAARSNFTNRMRDVCALKCVVKDNRFEKIWKHDAPWRAAGFYQALTWFWDGKPPTLQQIGVTRPTDVYKNIFLKIAAQAENVL